MKKGPMIIMEVEMAPMSPRTKERVMNLLGAVKEWLLVDFQVRHVELIEDEEEDTGRGFPTQRPLPGPSEPWDSGFRGGGFPQSKSSKARDAVRRIRGNDDPD